MLKRANVILFTKKGVYYRPAGKDRGPSFRCWFVPYPDANKADIWSAEGQASIGLWKDGDRKMPASWHEDMAWSLAYLRICKNGGNPPSSITTLSPPLFPGSSESIVEEKPSIQKLLHVKEEIAAQGVFKKLKFNGESTCFDLCSPPKKLRGGTNPSNAEMMLANDAEGDNDLEMEDVHVY